MFVVDGKFGYTVDLTSVLTLWFEKLFMNFKPRSDFIGSFTFKLGYLIPF